MDLALHYSVPFRVAQKTKIGLPTENCCRLEYITASSTFANAKSLVPFRRWTPITCLVSLQGLYSSPNLGEQSVKFILMKYCALTSKTTAGADSPVPHSIHRATSWMFGTVAETRIKRTEDPRSFIREMTTSRVLPRDSFKMCTWHTDVGKTPL